LQRGPISTLVQPLVSIEGVGLSNGAGTFDPSESMSSCEFLRMASQDDRQVIITKTAEK